MQAKTNKIIKSKKVKSLKKLYIKKKSKKLNTQYLIKNKNYRNILSGGNYYNYYASGVYGCAFKPTDEKDKTILKLSIYNYDGFNEMFKDEIKNEIEVNLKLKEESTKNSEYYKYFSIILEEPIYLKTNIRGDTIVLKDDRPVVNNNNVSIVKNIDIKSLIDLCNKEGSTDIFSDLKGKGKDIIYVLIKMPFGGITLDNYFDKTREEFNIEEFNSIINKILYGLKLLHNLKIYHGDFHFSNILYDNETQTIKIIDFGKSKVCDGDMKEYFSELLDKIWGFKLYGKRTKEVYNYAKNNILKRKNDDIYKIIDLIRLQEEIFNYLKNIYFSINTDINEKIKSYITDIVKPDSVLDDFYIYKGPEKV